MKKLKGPHLGKTTITVSALFGEFRTLASNVVVRYASTFANSSRNDGHRDLLRQMSPVRECIDADKLRSLASLLQRDLNDERVAHDLIPYLKGNFGFFPAIVAALMPQGYLQGEGSVQAYPTPSGTGLTHDYGGCWKTSRYSTDNEQGEEIPLSLGQVEIAVNETDIIILDGQHRANAFRVLAGDSELEKTAYKPFYESIKPQQWSCDLPVTLIWFVGNEDSSEIINPTLISRRLFIDVNNSARPVNRARRILLDDRTVTCVATQVQYEGFADRGFSPQKMSLLHSAFDMQSDLSQRLQPATSLTTPEILHESLLWAFFGSDRYNNLTTWEVQRRRTLSNRERFVSLFDEHPIHSSIDEDFEEEYFSFNEVADAADFRNVYQERFAPVLLQIFERLNCLAPHFKACQEVEAWARSATMPDEEEAWNKIFCGGEGLYWTYVASNLEESKRFMRYRKAITDIEARLRSERAKLFADTTVGSVNSFYTSVTTKAFQTGIVMAVHYLIEQALYEDAPSAADDLVSALNKFSLEQWVFIVNELRPELVRGVDPKKWPTYRNIFLRMLDQRQHLIFTSDRVGGTPEWRAVRLRLEDYADAYETIEGRPPEGATETRVKEEVESVLSLFASCGLSWPALHSPDLTRKGVRLVERKIEDKFRKLEDGSGTED